MLVLAVEDTRVLEIVTGGEDFTEWPCCGGPVIDVIRARIPAK
jgi:hypothetical protein